MKKGMALSFETIVIAIISLVVLIVLLAIFTGKANFFSQATETCSSRGGHCAYQEQCQEDELLTFSGDCPFYPPSQSKKLGQCCVKL